MNQIASRILCVCVCLGWAAMISGCGSHEPPLAGVSAPRASQTEASGPETRATPAEVRGAETPATPTEAAPTAEQVEIAAQYREYRAQAFAGVDGIEAAEVKDAVRHRPILLVDCREDAEQAISMIDGAITRAAFEADPERYRDRLVVPYCTIGYRSGVYAKTLADRGFDVRNLVGGVLTWAHVEGPFIDGDGRPTRRVHVYGAAWDLLPETYVSVYEGKPSP